MFKNLLRFFSTKRSLNGFYSNISGNNIKNFFETTTKFDKKFTIVILQLLLMFIYYKLNYYMLWLTELTNIYMLNIIWIVYLSVNIWYFCTTKWALQTLTNFFCNLLPILLAATVINLTLVLTEKFIFTINPNNFIIWIKLINYFLHTIDLYLANINIYIYSLFLPLHMLLYDFILPCITSLNKVIWITSHCLLELVLFIDLDGYKNTFHNYINYLVILIGHIILLIEEPAYDLIVNVLYLNDEIFKPIKHDMVEVKWLEENVNYTKTIHTLPINLNINMYSGVNTHFPVHKATMITTLTVWQYWWWMWFFFIIIAFNKLILKFFFQNTLKIEPKIHTSIKSNGRWGDLVASIFPVFWCSNILLNSNLILKIIENHTESGMFLVRIRGKQWYWIYKFSVNLKNDITSPGIIIGRNNKLKATYAFVNNKVDNMVNPHSRWKKKINNEILINKNKYTKQHIALKKTFNLRINTIFSDINNKNLIFFKTLTKHNKFYLNTTNTFLDLQKTYKCHNNRLFILKNKTTENYKKYNRHFVTLQQQPKNIWHLIKKNKVISFNKITNLQTLKLKKIKPINSLEKNHFIKKFRMINTYNTLILPINTNITIVTNSFDVVHSWFVPGLGLKLDCVPGRSTHYTLRINKPGIYYGHCAEVCGRFHHYMPIRVCALPFNQFIYYHNLQYDL